MDCELLRWHEEAPLAVPRLPRVDRLVLSKIRSLEEDDGGGFSVGQMAVIGSVIRLLRLEMPFLTHALGGRHRGIVDEEHLSALVPSSLSFLFFNLNHGRDVIVVTEPAAQLGIQSIL